MKLKKKFLCALVAVGMLATVLTGCGKKDSNTFTVGFDAEYPPYGYMDENGEYTGFDLELAEEVCKLNGCLTAECNYCTVRLFSLENAHYVFVSQRLKVKPVGCVEVG